MFLFVGFNHLLRFHQCIGHGSYSLLFLPQDVAEGVHTLLIMVELSQAQLQAVLVKVLHKCLVLLGLVKQEV